MSKEEIYKHYREVLNARAGDIFEVIEEIKSGENRLDPGDSFMILRINPIHFDLTGVFIYGSEPRIITIGVEYYNKFRKKDF